ncbi:MAG: hypothetical protein KKG60_00415 [Nanoarchaeota archaeon]|nr:hypothetical protein [Nanoarchaeota archaeon]
MKKLMWPLIACIWLLVVGSLLLMLGDAARAESNSVIFPGNNLKLTIQKYEPDPVESGGVFDLYLRAEALYSAPFKNDIKNLKIELVENFPFSGYSTKVKELGTLKEGNVIDFRYRIKVDAQAAEGYNEIYFKYYSGDTLMYTSPLLEIKIAPLDTSLAVSEISTEPERIEQGVASKIGIKIKNTADSVMKDVKVKIELGSIAITTLNSVNEKKIRILEKGETSEVFFDVITDADADSGVYNIPLNLTYHDEEGNLINKNYEFGLLVGGEPEYLLNAEDSDGLVKGKSGKVVISLSNTGVGDIKFAIITLLGGKDYDVVSKDKVYLGNLESDDYETAEFTIYPKKSGNIGLDVLIEYKDAFNKEINKVEKVGVMVYTKGQATKYGLMKKSGGVLTLVFYLVIILLVISGYRNWKKCRNVDKACKITLKNAALVLKKIIRSISIRKFFALVKKVIKFFREP